LPVSFPVQIIYRIVSYRIVYCRVSPVRNADIMSLSDERRPSGILIYAHTVSIAAYWSLDENET